MLFKSWFFVCLVGWLVGEGLYFVRFGGGGWGFVWGFLQNCLIATFLICGRQYPVAAVICCCPEIIPFLCITGLHLSGKDLNVSTVQLHYGVRGSRRRAAGPVQLCTGRWQKARGCR